MKKLIFSIIVIIGLFFYSHVSAFEIRPNVIVSSPNEATLSDVRGCEIEARWRNILFFVSQTQATKFLVGQTVGTYQILGAGAGYILPLVKYFSMSGRFGYYQPKMHYKPEKDEAIYRELHRLSKPVDKWRMKPGVLCCEGYELDYDFRTCQYETTGSLGGDIRLNFDVPIANHVRFNLFVSYRVLEFDTRISANIKGLPIRSDGFQAFHEFYGKDNFSGGQIGIGVSIKW